MFKKSLSILVILLLSFLFLQTAFAQDTTKVKFLEYPTLSKYLSLNEEQSKKGTAIIDSIKANQTAQREQQQAMRAQFQPGEMPDQETMQKLRADRQKNVELVKGMIERYKSLLTKEQLELFNKNVELPNFERRGGGGNRPPRNN